MMDKPHSLIGRTATVKMKILPQINYLFSMLPTTPTEQWFKFLNSINQLYSEKKQKTNKYHYQLYRRKKSQGGTKLFTIRVANQLQYLAKWTHQPKHGNPWIDLEQSQCKNISRPTISALIN